MEEDRTGGESPRGRQSTPLSGRNRHIAWSAAIAAGLLVFLAALPEPVRSALARSLLAYRFLAGMLLIFALIALSLLWSAGQQADAWAFSYFNLRGTRPGWLDGIMLAFTQIGNGFTSLVIALIFYLADDRRLALLVILGTLTLWLCVELVKAVVRRSRPFVRVVQTRIVGGRARGRSFPSGHTSQAFFLATLMAQHFQIGFWAALILYTAAILVAITRMYLGAHYPRDVLAGAILGSVWGILASTLGTRFPVL
jgi:membrane-associated phospholipid phosphatase